MEKIESIRLEISQFIDYLKKKYNLSEQEIFEAYDLRPSFSNIPICIFNSKLGIMESIIKYLKENINLKNNEIAEILKKNQRTVWSTYNNAKKKMSEKFVIQDSINVPISIFCQKKYGALELLSEYLKEKYNLSYRKIGQLLERDERTIWSSYNKLKIKKQQLEKINENQ